MTIGEKVEYKTSKNSLKTFHGHILGFKGDKMNVSKYRYKDLSGGTLVPTWIDKEDIL